jgi:hypothetical protein
MNTSFFKKNNVVISLYNQSVKKIKKLLNSDFYLITFKIFKSFHYLFINVKRTIYY